MATLFISDLHLEDSTPAALEQLSSLITGPARKAEALYILGDLFEYWIGDDALSACAREVANLTSGLVAEGVPCFFQHGNRDFLLGNEFAELAGLQLLPETRLLDLYGRKTVLLHGDTLCTDDVEYQAFRLQVRNPQWQAQVLALSIEERIKLAQSARDASQQHTGSAAMEIMDVNQEAVVKCFHQNDVQHMIHGHTHRPAVHRHDLGDGQFGERIVLSDWYRAGSYLEVDADGARSIAL